MTLIDGPQSGRWAPACATRSTCRCACCSRFLVGVGIVFLLDYLDNSVRSRADVEALGLPVLGEIPRAGK